jgi:hypothetical protein
MSRQGAVGLRVQRVRFLPSCASLDAALKDRLCFTPNAGGYSEQQQVEKGWKGLQALGADRQHSNDADQHAHDPA